ncbi:MAG TPA: efflux RND transporter periplasmic adaptor subunit [Bryobacteraceae bacterium]|nr:efflux RND transporter periplasmic adaptor subunit [Bryobacteraceae bacterium]
MLRSVCPLAPAVPLLLLVSCSHSSLPVTHAASTPGGGGEPDLKREVRITGIVQAVHSFKVLVPQITGQNNRMSLTHIVASGTHVETGDPIASFDATTQMDALRDASAKFDDLGHQADQKRAQNRADAEKRATDLLQAEGDLSKALIELRKGPVLAEIKRLENEEKARIARLHVESLKKSMAEHDRSDAAALRILELQRDRQKVAMERAQTNINKLNVTAPLAGMVAQATVYRGNTMGHPQEGDQLYRGQPLVSIFDPSEMLVRCAVGEPDIASIAPGSRAAVYLDAYPDIALAAHFESASPVASAGWDSPIKTFTAVFRIDRSDSHLLPDLSAAVVLETKGATGGSK